MNDTMQQAIAAHAGCSCASNGPQIPGYVIIDAGCKLHGAKSGYGERPVREVKDTKRHTAHSGAKE